MIQDKKDKELLLRDLCAKLPYNVKVYDTKGNFDSSCQTLAQINCLVGEAFVVSGYVCRTAPITDIKPYLFPMSSMTEEQKKYLKFKCDWNDYEEDAQSILVLYHKQFVMKSDVFDWLDKNHFDYRGLIEKGLAIDCTNLNIY